MGAEERANELMRAMFSIAGSVGQSGGRVSIKPPRGKPSGEDAATQGPGALAGAGGAAGQQGQTPQTTPPPAKPSLPKPLISDPNLTSKLGGSVELKTDAKFTALDMSQASKTEEDFRATHQLANDEVARKIARGLRDGSVEIDGNKGYYDEDEAEE